MNINIDRDGMIEALALVSIVAKRDDRVRLTAASGKLVLAARSKIQVSLDAEVIEGGEIAFQIGQFSDTVTYSPVEKIGLRTASNGTGRALRIEAGATKGKLPLWDAETLTQPPVGQTGELLTLDNIATFRALIERVKPALREEDGDRPGLAQITFVSDAQGLSAYALSAQKMARARTSEATSPDRREIRLPSEAIRQVTQVMGQMEGPVHFQLGQERFCFSGERVLYSHPALTTAPPDVDHLFTLDDPIKIIVDAKEFRRALHSVQPAIDTERPSPVAVKFAPGAVRFRAKDPIRGELVTEIPALGGGEALFGFNLHYLLQAAAGSGELEICYTADPATRSIWSIKKDPIITNFVLAPSRIF